MARRVPRSPLARARRRAAAALPATLTRLDREALDHRKEIIHLERLRHDRVRLDVANRSALIGLALSEAGFGLTVARRRSPPSPLGASATPASLEAEALAYAQAPFMVAVTQGPEHRYTFVNRIAAEVAGRSSADLVGKTVRDLYPGLDPQFGAALDDAFRTGRPWSRGAPTLVRWTQGDGSVRESRVNLIFQPVRDVTGAVVGLLHIGAEAGPAS